MLERYPLREELGKTMFVFEKFGKYYGHIIKSRTDKAPALLVFETAKYESIELLKADYPPFVEKV
ncbi:hypothetical protein [Paenibacillus sp. GP183]|jgi:hypothetical protein|uniref:hypothetical protein n=1 Tax=Paenibacillus sp. GP183 TaxID=1882751 RepID=UPI00089505E6|nr:hypothetical protein [Paenibacillus sp. GP183]SEC78248.1 hypothetical protein SAMN05443246_5357 [Paenibacillus sp. GP183]